MASSELRRLHRLHEIDQALLEIRKRAAALDPGREAAAELKALQTRLDAAPAKKLQAELNDLELQQKSLDDKIKRYDKDLYGGKVVHPREVEAMEKEIAHLKGKRADLDGRMLELWEELPEAKREAEALEGAVSEAQKRLAQAQKAALALKKQLETDYAAQSQARPVAAKEVPPALLAKYEMIRQKHHGAGMGDVDVKKKTCAACGMNLPTRSIELLKEDKTVVCEACHRILYYTEGLV